MEEQINKIADAFYKDMESFFKPDLSAESKEIIKSEFHRVIRNTVSDTGSFINNVIFDAVNKSKANR